MSRGLPYETKTYEFREAFGKISIDDDSGARIRFALSDDGVCKIECLEDKKVKRSISIVDGTLVIHAADAREGHGQFGIAPSSKSIVIYLPKCEYDSLDVKVDTSDVDIPSGFVFHRVSIAGDTANILCKGVASDVAELCTDTGEINLDAMDVSGSLLIETDTGDVRLNSVNADGTINIKSDTGMICLTDVNCKDFAADSDTGDIYMEKVIADAIAIASDTGKVEFESCDANSLDIGTDTGNVRGTLLSDKNFFIKTALGDVDVPKTTTGGKCRVTTDTGSIQIRFADADGRE